MGAAIEILSYLDFAVRFKGCSRHSSQRTSAILHGQGRWEVDAKSQVIHLGQPFMIGRNERGVSDDGGSGGLGESVLADVREVSQTQRPQRCVDHGDDPENEQDQCG